MILVTCIEEGKDNATGHFVGIFYESVLVRSDSIEQDWSIRARDEGNLIGCDVRERLKGAIYIGNEPKREGKREVVSRHRWSLVSPYYIFSFLSFNCDCGNEISTR